MTSPQPTAMGSQQRDDALVPRSDSGGSRRNRQATLTSRCSLSSALISVLQDWRFGPEPDGQAPRELR